MSRHTVAYLAALALLAACDKESTVVQIPHSDVASVTVVNTTPLVVKPFVGTQLASTTNLQAASWMQNCAFIPPGSTSLTFKDLADADIASTPPTTFAAGTRYTTLLTQNGTTNTAFVLPETFTTLTPGNYGVRIVNATGVDGDFYVMNTATGAIPAGTAVDATLTNNTATGGTTGTGAYLTKPVTSPFVRMFAPGNTTTQLASLKLADNSNLVTNVTWTQGTTVVFARNSSGAITAQTFGQCQ